MPQLDYYEPLEKRRRYWKEGYGRYADDEMTGNLYCRQLVEEYKECTFTDVDPCRRVQSFVLMFLRFHRRVLLRISREWQRSYSLQGVPIDISLEVKDALQHGSPVVALESAIVTHGMPHPTNLQTALSVESKVRSAGSIPATIGVLAGRIVVGLQRSQLENLADKDADVVKLSRRDLAPAVGLGKSGGTTIAATSVIASLVGIRVSLGQYVPVVKV